MYRHLLVPLDGTPLATYVIGQAVEFARHMEARITFFHAAPAHGAMEEGALNSTISPDIFALESSGEVRAILAKAEASARVAHVASDSIGRISDRPYETILGGDGTGLRSHFHGFSWPPRGTRPNNGLTGTEGSGANKAPGSCLHGRTERAGVSDGDVHRDHRG
jgi:hypothetical protein